MTTKQITFNLSSLSSSHKTKKHREIKNKPIISPNVLKNKLLKRIKEHKKKEQSETNQPDSKLNVENNSTDILAYTDEFNDSIDYLQGLSKQKQIEQKREQLYRQTLKNNNTSVSNIQVYNDLPDELKPEMISLNNSLPLQLNNLDTVPYGVLKNGNKPTFREWTKTQKNISCSLQPTNELNEREKKLADLKERFRRQSVLESNQNIPLISVTPPTNTVASIPLLNSSLAVQNISSNMQSDQINSPYTMISSDISNKIEPVQKMNSVMQTITPIHTNITQLPKPKFTKYTLGKQNQTIGVLLKDNKTRKNIMTAQKNLRQKNISQIKEYLKDHNLIKVGSSAPSDVLRKMFESAMLAGEITNSNKDILLHNFMKT
jgi:hypothetical protein